MNELSIHFNPQTDLAPILIGALLLIWGRRFYWLALGAVGFLLGNWLAVDVLTLAERQLELGVGFLFGVLGALAAVFAQKIAVKIAGLILGGGAVLWFAVPYQHQLDLWIWPLVIIGAAIGLMLANTLFSSALIFISSLVGANLITEALFTGSQHEIWIFLGLFTLGVLLQSRKRRRSDD